MTSPTIDEPLAVLLERDLTTRYGPMLSSDNLWLVLGYASKEAFRQALVRKTVPVPIFTLAHRRGKFALTKDIATWLAAQRERVVTDRKNATKSPQASYRTQRKGGVP